VRRAHSAGARAALGLALIAALAAARLAAAPNDGRDAPAPLPPPDTTSYVAVTPGPGFFPLVAAGRAAPLWLSDGDYPGVIRAARDLQGDIRRVTDAEPTVAVGARPAGRTVVIAGTIGKSAIIDSLVRRKTLDVAGLAGRWEMFLLQVVRDPLPGIDRALVIVGSDKRGTIYGLYDLSARIGVSPWVWWADVPPKRSASLYVRPGRHSDGEPAVKYRGIFINDEAPAFTGWARETFGGVDHRVYTKVFELILRLKGNYLWPAMWGNAFVDDDSLDAPLADEYGIVMGTSHHEPMTLAQQEWRRYGRGPWNYEQNDSVLRAFWRHGIERTGTRENIVTIGMRGDGDMPMTEGSNIALLERIVADQRRIIADVTQRDPAATPQLWALYKEVQDYYDKGMRVPDDVTLLFADDNWGNIRRLPAAADRHRPGGFGVYYHFDYVGGPRNYKWLNTNPIARVWEQMHLAHELGANRIWIVNVGDIKPMELPISFFLDYAWNPDRWPPDRLPEYVQRWAEVQFGPAHAAAIAETMTRTLMYVGRRKPELLAPETYSLPNYREAERVVAGYDSLLAAAERIGAALPDEYRDAYYQLVLHPVQAAANLNDLYVTVARNRLYALQGRAATNALADRARALFERDAEISRDYDTRLAGGKWRHMMDQTHIGYTYWQEPPRNVMPRVDVIQVPVPAEMGVAWEGQVPFGPPAAGPPGGSRVAELPMLDTYTRGTRWIDIYNRGQTPFAFSAAAAEPWVRITPSTGTIGMEQRLEVGVDWDHAPIGLHRVPIRITGPTGTRQTVLQAVVHNPAAPARDAVAGFVEGNGYVSMEAEHYTRAVAAHGIIWQRIPDLGRTLSGVTAMPVTAPSRAPGGDGPRLEYRMTLFDSGTVAVRTYTSPTLDFSGAKTGVRYAISFDDEPPQVVDITADSSAAGWERAVADNVRILETRHRLARPGSHTLQLWFVDPGVVVQKIVVDAGGARPSYLGPPESYRR
jgi:glycosyl hydrolase family 115 (putative glucuronidase)/glycosyl hydrolase family 115